MFSVQKNILHMHFTNGNVLSAVFDNKRGDDIYATVSAWDKDGAWIILGSGESIPWVTADELLALMKRVSGDGST